MNKELYISINTVNRMEKLFGYSFNFENRISGSKMFLRNNSLNTTYDNPIYNDVKGVFKTSNGKQPIKLGKILKQLITDITPLEIEEHTTAWKARYTVDTATVITSKEIRRVYDISHVGGSCMAMKGESMEIYEDLNCSIAYILHPEDYTRLLARALLWDDNVTTTSDESTPIKIMDRVFFEKEEHKITLKQWALENGFKSFTSITLEDDVITIDAVPGSYTSVPYIDNMIYAWDTRDGYRLTTDSYDHCDVLQETDGSSTNNSGISDNTGDKIYCENTGTYEGEDECYYCETDECMYYGTDDLVYVEDGNGYYRFDDDNICDLHGGYYGFKDECFYATDTGTWYADTNDLTFCDDINDYVVNDYAYIEDLDVYWYNFEDAFYSDKTMSYWSSERAYYEVYPGEDVEHEEEDNE
jgi:hypothetical protein